MASEKESIEMLAKSNADNSFILQVFMWKFAELTLIDWVGELTSLAEDLLSIYLFDEDNFPTILVFLVFMLEPMADNIFKTLMKCTKSEWDDFAYDILSEGVQCFLYIHFSSYSDAALLWFPIILGVQVAMLIVQKVLDLMDPQEETDDERTDKICESCMACCKANFQIIFSSLQPLPLTLYQDNAPFTQTSFDTILTIFYFTQGLLFTLKSTQDEEKSKDQKVEQPREIAILTNFLNFAVAAFGIYVYILACIYWNSGKIETSHDKNYTSYIVIGWPITLVSLLCQWFIVQKVLDLMNPQEKKAQGIQIEITNNALVSPSLTFPDSGASPNGPKPHPGQYSINEMLKIKMIYGPCLSELINEDQAL